MSASRLTANWVAAPSPAPPARVRPSSRPSGGGPSDASTRRGFIAVRVPAWLRGVVVMLAGLYKPAPYPGHRTAPQRGRNRPPTAPEGHRRSAGAHLAVEAVAVGH